MANSKQRHGCLTAWLIIMMIANTVVVMIYLFASGVMKQTYPSAPGWAFPILILGGKQCYYKN